MAKAKRTAPPSKKAPSKWQRVTNTKKQPAQDPESEPEPEKPPEPQYVMAAPVLQKHAESAVPPMTIKPESVWVGIVFHTIHSLQDVQGNGSFLWMKCHRHISVRTLKFHYFRRHPLEDFELKHLNYYPAEHDQVAHLCSRSPFQRSRVIVLRAIEADYRDTADRLDRQDKKLAKRNGQSLYGFDAVQPSAQEPIVLDETPTDRSDGGSSVMMLSHTNASGQHKQADDGHLSSSNSRELSPEIHAALSPREISERFSMLPQGVKERLQAIEDEHHGFLPYVLSHTYQTCQVHECGQRCVLRPWTHFANGDNPTPLCTQHSYDVVEWRARQSGRSADLLAAQRACHEMQAQRDAEFLEKVRLHLAGARQNMADDAPLNHPLALPPRFSTVHEPGSGAMTDEGFEIASLPADYQQHLRRMQLAEPSSASSSPTPSPSPPPAAPSPFKQPQTPSHARPPTQPPTPKAKQTPLSRKSEPPGRTGQQQHQPNQHQRSAPASSHPHRPLAQPAQAAKRPVWPTTPTRALPADQSHAKGRQVWLMEEAAAHTQRGQGFAHRRSKSVAARGRQRLDDTVADAGRVGEWGGGEDGSGDEAHEGSVLDAEDS